MVKENSALFPSMTKRPRPPDDEKQEEKPFPLLSLFSELRGEVRAHLSRRDRVWLSWTNRLLQGEDPVRVPANFAVFLRAAMIEPERTLRWRAFGVLEKAGIVDWPEFVRLKFERRRDSEVWLRSAPLENTMFIGAVLVVAPEEAEDRRIGVYRALPPLSNGLLGADLARDALAAHHEWLRTKARLWPPVEYNTPWPGLEGR